MNFERNFIGGFLASRGGGSFSIPAKPVSARVCPRPSLRCPRISARTLRGSGEMVLTAGIESGRMGNRRVGEQLSWESTTFATWGARGQSPSPPPSFPPGGKDGAPRIVDEGGLSSFGLRTAYR